VGMLLFMLNVFWSLRSGEMAGDNPWGGGSLEWAAASPPQPYNFAALPTVGSRYPVWDMPADLSAYPFAENLDRRETLGTTAIDAEPEMRVLLPGNTIIPFLLAIAITVILVAILFDLRVVQIFSAVSLILLAIWHWPRGRENSMEWVKSGPDNALPVSTVVQGKAKPPFYYGMLLFVVIEAVEFLALIASYFYLRSSTSDWPPGDMHLPTLLIPTIATVLMVTSGIPTYLGDHAIKKNDQRGLIVNLIVTIVLEAAFMTLLIAHLRSLSFDWMKNAYASAFFVLIFLHLVFAGVMILENLYILIQAQRGFYNAERHWGVEVDGMSSYLVIASWVAIYATVFLSPYLI